MLKFFSCCFFSKLRICSWIILVVVQGYFALDNVAKIIGIIGVFVVWVKTSRERSAEVVGTINLSCWRLHVCSTPLLDNLFN